MQKFLTIHQLVSVPYANLNRDDTGSPKTCIQGGVIHGMLSSQSIKRSARTAYEAASQNISVRSANLANAIVERAQEINPDLNTKDAEKLAKKAVGALTKGAEKDDQDSNRSTWLSGEEIEATAQTIAEGQKVELDKAEFMGAGTTGALAIAAFGRMFANAASQNVEAAIAVSPAVTTHAATIDNDYFTTVDDNPTEEQGAGATFLGIAQYTNGVFYRSTTIDREQLHRSWSGIDNPEAKEQLAQMVEALLYALPKGKKNSTAPYVMPDFLLAETQSHRVAYDFEQPVKAKSKDGGYMTPSIERLKEQFDAARRFDPENFGDLCLVSGVNPAVENFPTDTASKKQFIDAIVDWIL